MKQTLKIDNAEIELTDELVVIRRKGISRPIVANILGIDRDSEGNRIILYLDRIVHNVGEDTLGGWKVRGAISTVMESPEFS